MDIIGILNKDTELAKRNIEKGREIGKTDAVKTARIESILSQFNDVALHIE